MTESEIQAQVRLEAARRGWHLWRNNSGVLLDRTGRPVRYGLANDSAGLNAALKSSDLIGWTDTGRFVSIECKSPGGAIHPAQLAWLKLVEKSGGIAILARSIGDLGKW